MARITTRRTRMTWAALAAAALLIIGAAAGDADDPNRQPTPETGQQAPAEAPAPKAPQKPEPADADAKKQSLTVEGKIVNLHLFLTRKPMPAYAGEGADRPDAERFVGTLAREVPIGIWVEKESVVARLIPGKPVYLIFFDPEDDAQAKAYAQARRLLGRSVTLVGSMYERSGLTGLRIEQVEPVEQLTDAAEQ